jgi:curved DNA-binding protein CbpA
MTPFEVLGLPATDLTDDEVRAAWRRIAEATHPDLEDGGDPVAYAAAASAYTLLRTSSGRGEALADLRDPGTAARGRATRISQRGWLRLAARLVVAAAVVALAVAVAGWQPASVAILAGMMTWLLLTGRRDYPRAHHFSRAQRRLAGRNGAG